MLHRTGAGPCNQEVGEDYVATDNESRSCGSAGRAACYPRCADAGAGQWPGPYQTGRLWRLPYRSASSGGDEDLPSYPHIFGHEGVGRIVAIGKNVSGTWKEGDRVGLPYLYDTCLDCPQCLTGQETFCTKQHARGVFVSGAFAEFALLDSRFAAHIPDNLHPVKDAPLLCAGLTAWSALKKTRIGPGAAVSSLAAAASVNTPS